MAMSPLPPQKFFEQYGFGGFGIPRAAPIAGKRLRCGNAEAEVSLQIEPTGVSLPRAVYAVR